MTMQEHHKISVRYLPVSDLVGYQNNARTHSDDQIDKLATSIREFGFTNPILVDGDNTIIAGHGRLQAAKRVGLREVPTILLDHLTEAQRRAYILADNRLALDAGWDEELLKIELEGLRDMDFDLAMTGFADDELADLLSASTLGLTDPDDVPEVQEQAISTTGDIWTCGQHRIMCGNSTSAADVSALLAGIKPNLMVTDPPYGVNYDASWRKIVSNGNNSSLAVGKVMNEDRSDWREAWALFPGNVAYIWHGSLHAVSVYESLLACKFKVRSQIVWVKNAHVISRGNYHNQHEPAFYAVRDIEDDGFRFDAEHELAAYAIKEGKTAEYRGGRKQSTVWFIDRVKNTTGHSTQKPVECMRRPIVNNSSAGQAVYEPFSGSGTTLIAAEQTGRVCLAMELSPHYVDVAVRRWQEFTGKDAVRADGVGFNELGHANG